MEDFEKLNKLEWGRRLNENSLATTSSPGMWQLVSGRRSNQNKPPPQQQQEQQQQRRRSNGFPKNQTIPQQQQRATSGPKSQSFTRKQQGGNSGFQNSESSPQKQQLFVGRLQDKTTAQRQQQSYTTRSKNVEKQGDHELQAALPQRAQAESKVATDDRSAHHSDVITSLTTRIVTHPLRQQHEGLSPQRWCEKTERGTHDKTRRPPPQFNIEADSKARKSWRNNEPAKDFVGIPSDLVVQDRFHQTIAHENETFVCTNDDRPGHGDITFGIWGEEEAVVATRQAIEARVKDWQGPSKSQGEAQRRSQGKSHRGSRWAKVVSLTPARRDKVEALWLVEVRRQRFRRRPPPDMTFGAIGTFHWSLAYRPEEVFGSNYEALDPIRMDCRAYIIFDSERNAFQVMGKVEPVKNALVRIRKACFQVVARQIAPVRLYLLHWPEGTRLPSYVALEPYQGLKTTSECLEYALMNSPLARGEDFGSRPVNGDSSAIEARVGNVLLRTLSKLHYLRGQIRLRIRLGRFLATQFKKPTEGVYTFNDYEQMIGESQFTGEVTQE